MNRIKDVAYNEVANHLHESILAIAFSKDANLCTNSCED